MDWSPIITGIGAAFSVASGGIFGVLGSLVGAVSKYYQTKQEREWQKEKWKHEKDLLALQMQAKSAETEQELAIVAQTGSWTGLSESHKSDQSIGPVSQWVNNIRSLFRPFLTIALWGLAGWIFYHVAIGSLKTWITQMEIKEIIKYMVYTVFFCASSATMWWFGDRALSPPGLNKKK